MTLEETRRRDRRAREANHMISILGRAGLTDRLIARLANRKQPWVSAVRHGHIAPSAAALGALRANARSALARQGVSTLQRLSVALFQYDHA